MLSGLVVRLQIEILDLNPSLTKANLVCLGGWVCFQPSALGGSVSSSSPGNACWGGERPVGGGPLAHTLQCVVLTGIPILEANTTVSAEASSIVNPL